MSVGSVCVLGEPWLELLADRVQLLLLLLLLLLLRPKLFVNKTNFLGVRLVIFLNKGQFSTLSPQSA